MESKTSRNILCAALCMCVAGAIAFGRDPSGGQADGESTPFGPGVHSTGTNVKPELQLEVTEGVSSIVAKYKEVVKQLSALLEERDHTGVPTLRAHHAAKALIALDSREVLPFLARNIGFDSGNRFIFGAEPVLEICPYVLPLIQHKEFGARAVVEVVAKRGKDHISDGEWTLYGYVLVNVFGDDESGRNAAIALIDRMDDRERKSASLEVLRERVRTAKSVMYR